MSELPQVIVYGRGDKIPNDYIKINSTSKSGEWRVFKNYISLLFSWGAQKGKVCQW